MLVSVGVVSMAKPRHFSNMCPHCYALMRSLGLFFCLYVSSLSLSLCMSMSISKVSMLLVVLVMLCCVVLSNLLLKTCVYRREGEEAQEVLVGV